MIKEKLDRAREILSGYVLYEKFSADHVAQISSLTGVSLENVCKVKCPRTGKDNNFLVVRFSGEAENYVGFSWKKRIVQMTGRLPLKKTRRITPKNAKRKPSKKKRLPKLQLKTMKLMTLLTYTHLLLAPTILIMRTKIHQRK